MPNSNTSPSHPDAAALNAAFTALGTYDQGSSRGDLVPIDQAVKASLGDEPARAALEQRLVGALQRGGSAVAMEFICSKLAMIGGKSSVAALAALVGRAEFATAAHNALEAIPLDRASKVLRDSLPKLVGLQKVGVINSLGARRDADSLRALAALLKSVDPEVVAAAIAAVGEIGTDKAARILVALEAKCPVSLRPTLADAMLVCAERLLVAGKKTVAAELYRTLVKNGQPTHIRQAASRGLERCIPRK